MVLVTGPTGSGKTVSSIRPWPSLTTAPSISPLRKIR
ncbi:MAG: hypothetical protein R2864_10420 [Syntrophotaleaceae bacterium]